MQNALADIVKPETEAKPSWHHLQHYQERGSTGAPHSFLTGSQFFDQLRKRPWTVQLTRKDPVDLFVLTGEDFHPGVRTDVTVADRYETLRNEASDDGLVGIPIVLAYGTIIREEVQQNGSTSVRGILLAPLTEEQQDAATVILVSFYKDTRLKPTKAQAGPHPESSAAQDLILPDCGDAKHLPCHVKDALQTSQEQMDAEGYSPIRSTMALPTANCTTIQPAMQSTDRVALVPVDGYARFLALGARGVSVNRGFYENMTFPVHELSERLEHIRRASMGLELYHVVPAQPWIPDRRRLIKANGELPVRFAESDGVKAKEETRRSDEDVRRRSKLGGAAKAELRGKGAKRAGPIAFDVPHEGVVITKKNEERLGREWRQTYEDVMGLVNWDLCTEPGDEAAARTGQTWQAMELEIRARPTSIPAAEDHAEDARTGEEAGRDVHDTSKTNDIEMLDGQSVFGGIADTAHANPSLADLDDWVAWQEQ